MYQKRTSRGNPYNFFWRNPWGDFWILLEKYLVILEEVVLVPHSLSLENFMGKFLEEPQEEFLEEYQEKLLEEVRGVLLE